VTLVGKTLGKFQMLAEIGQGGMGVVYRGFDPTLNRPVAIKVLAPELTWDPSLVARFRREAQTVAALFHPNIVNIHDIREQDGVHYSPKWSPDGSRIAFASTRDHVDNRWSEVYVMSSSGGNQRRLASNRADDEAPAWSPDGQWIVFSSRRHSCPGVRDDGGCDWDLYRIRPDGSGVTRLTNTPDLDEYNPIWWGP
jgi:serine/threonine protein kinase